MEKRLGISIIFFTTGSWFSGDMTKTDFRPENGGNTGIPRRALRFRNTWPRRAPTHFRCGWEAQAFGKPQEAPYSPYSVVRNLLFKNGIPGLFSFYCAGKKHRHLLSGCGRHWGDGYLENRIVGLSISPNDSSSEQVPYTPQRGYYNELLNFYNYRFNREPLFVTPEMGYGDTKMVLDILRSISEEAIIPVDVEPDRTQTSKVLEKISVF